MQRSIGRRVVLATLLLVAAPALLLLHPRARAATRLVGGFEPLEADGTILFESGADALATLLAGALPAAVARTEAVLGRPFRRPFRVYVCASTESFNRHTGQPSGSPVRGIAFLRDVWISPRAFDFRGRDTHRQSLIHELAHLYLDQHLGWLHRTRTVPTWFTEGLADHVAGTGFEIVTPEAARQQIAGGPRLVPDATGHLPLARGARDYGLSWPQLHAQSRLFVEHLARRDPEAFRGLLGSLLDREPFATAFRSEIGSPVDEAWMRFIQESATGRGAAAGVRPSARQEAGASVPARPPVGGGDGSG